MRRCRSQGDVDKETGRRVEKEKEYNKKSPPALQRLEMWHRNAMRAQRLQEPTAPVRLAHRREKNSRKPLLGVTARNQNVKVMKCELERIDLAADPRGCVSGGWMWVLQTACWNVGDNGDSGCPRSVGDSAMPPRLWEPRHELPNGQGKALSHRTGLKPGLGRGRLVFVGPRGTVTHSRLILN